ncbi:MAG: 16S rRNA (guanine(966)-N(2))-methyltransferase RsmD [Lachnospiraceae bacterium]|nr:16S rRNA (guanine(966)-N(2))-methyltransferase RsmD [Lachnospiraceae bacterium]
MRVIAGSARRLQLISPKGMDTRPTGDKIKETLFNILAPELYDVDFLDLFAGSGGIGIEALSRGAGSCTFIEKDREAIRCIKKNLEMTHFTDRASVYAGDVMNGIYNLTGKYGIVFMDPPYASQYAAQVLNALKILDITDEDTLFIAECGKETDMSFADAAGYDIIRIKEYKNSKHVFMKHRI